jgi:hypothetical protein
VRGEALRFSLSEPPPLPSGEPEDGALIHISAMLGNRSLGNQTSCGGARQPLLHGVPSEYMDCSLLTGRDCTKIARRIASPVFQPSPVNARLMGWNIGGAGRITSLEERPTIA